MFTGIIEELGTVASLSRRGRSALLRIKADKVGQDSKIGDSVAVNGVCLTVVDNDKKVLSFEVMEDTLKFTGLGSLKTHQKVNLERSLKLGDRLSGHFVLGHIDLSGVIRRKSYLNNNLCFQIAVTGDYMKYVLPRGSIAVDGISLTVAEKRSNTFSVYIIPHTLKNTTLNSKGPSDKVNIEFDILAKRTQNPS
jgi:riboflavin synthase